MSSYSTNDGSFLESMRLFFDEVAKHYPFDALVLEKIIKFYEKPDRTDDPLFELGQNDAKTLHSAQRRVAPELTDHPFFRRVSQIAFQLWSRNMQELIEAQNYLIQTEMGVGISPERGPRPEIIQVILNARKAVQTGVAMTRSPQVVVTKVSQSTSNFVSILKAFAKENW